MVLHRAALLEFQISLWELPSPSCRQEGREEDWEEASGRQRRHRTQDTEEVEEGGTARGGWGGQRVSGGFTDDERWFQLESHWVILCVSRSDDVNQRGRRRRGKDSESYIRIHVPGSILR